MHKTDQHKFTEMNNINRPEEKVKQQKYEEIHFVDSTKPVWNYSLFSPEDIDNFQRGTHYSLYNFFGSHEMEVLGKPGYYFAVWAPNATYISVIGNFNDWNPDSHPLYVRLESSGIWEGFIPISQKVNPINIIFMDTKASDLIKATRMPIFGRDAPQPLPSPGISNMTGMTRNG